MTTENKCAIISDSGQWMIAPIWVKLLKRLLQLPDGCHSVTLIKDGERVRWTISEGKVEGT